MSWRVIWIPELLGAVLGGIFVFRLGMGTMPKTVLHACEEVTGMLRENRRYENWVTGTEKKLRKNGAKFHYGKKITPVKYLLMRLFLSLGAVLALGTIGWGYALLAAMGLYYVPELLLLYLNRQDNRKMMPDLQLIYQALEVQTCAGVYVTDALTECCQSVRTQRLQQALMELSGDLVIQSDLVTALSDFQQKFDNRQIDALCITLIQAGESGQAVDLLKDMGEQLKDMELTVLQQQKVLWTVVLLFISWECWGRYWESFYMPVWDICSGQWCNSEIPIKQNKKGTKYEEFTENLGKSKRTCLTAGAGDRRDPGHCRSVYYCTVIVRGHEGQSDNVYTDHCNSDADQSGRYPDRGIG